MKRSFALLCAFAAIVIWGSNAVIIRHLAHEGVSTPAVAILRVVIGGTILIPWALSGHGRPTVASLRKPWPWLSVVCYGGNMLVFHVALSHAEAALVMLLENISPAITLLGAAVLFKEKISIGSIAALGFAGVGILLICGAGTNSSMSIQGGFLGILSGVTWGGYMLSCQGRASNENKCGNSAGALCFTLLGSGFFLTPLMWTAQIEWPKTNYAWGWIIVLGTIHTAAATLLWEKAIAELRAYVASIIFLMTIVITMVLASVFLGEPITFVMLIGGAAIALSASMAAVGRKPHPRQSRDE